MRFSQPLCRSLALWIPDKPCCLLRECLCHFLIVEILSSRGPGRSWGMWLWKCPWLLAASLIASLESFAGTFCRLIRSWRELPFELLFLQQLEQSSLIWANSWWRSQVLRKRKSFSRLVLLLLWILIGWNFRSRCFGVKAHGLSL